MKILFYLLVFIVFLPLAIRAQNTSPLCQVCWVTATVDSSDTRCLVDAAAPVSNYYDDGTAENYFAWVVPGGMAAVKLSSVFDETINVYGGSVYVGDGSWPEGADFLGHDFRVYVLDDDGPDGYPGTILDSVTVTVNNYYWVEFEGLNVDISDGYYYLAIKQLESPPYCPPIGVDEDYPVHYKYYIKEVDSLNWSLSPYNNLMIRAYTCSVQEGGENRDLDSYKLAFIDGFNPCNGEGPEDGTMNILSTNAGFPYVDDWSSLPSGYYAYAVNMFCDSVTSEWTYSNVVSHLMDVEVTVNVTCPDGNTPDSLVVVLDGNDCIQDQYFEASSDSGTVIFPQVPIGTYDMTVTIPGDHSETYDSVYIVSDTVMNINLDYELSPPDNFTVNAISSIATWDSPAGDDTDPWQYNIFLDDSLIAQVTGTEFSYFIDCLVYGQEYTAGIQAVYDCGESDTVLYSFTSGYLFLPRLLTASSTYGTDEVLLQFLPPKNCDGDVPPGLTSFNFYRNGEFIGTMPYEIPGDDWIIYIDNNIIPGEFNYCVTALYDLTPYGFPGQTGESSVICDTVEVIYGFDLPFTEDWSTGSFDYHDWTTTSSDWVVNQDEGNAKPSTNFHPTTSSSNYSASLASYAINTSQLTEGNIWLDFQLKLDDVSAGGTEKMTVEVNDGNDWNTVYERANEGSFDWDTIHLNITPYAMGNVFQFRFNANGENMDNISDWLIDNIQIYRTCPSFCDLEIIIDTVGYDQYVLNFGFTYCDTDTIGQWIEWDDGENYTGVGFACEEKACAAARWDANSLPTSLNGYKISKIKAFMYDVGYDSLQFQICTGDSGSTHVYTSDYKQPEETGWIEDNIDTTLFLDASLEYWVGYRLNIFGTYVFPMGADSGPAINGYGDMIKTCGSDTWDNLSDFGLDYNWNLAFYVKDTSGREIEIHPQNTGNLRTLSEFNLSGFNLYESINGGDYEWKDFLVYIDGEVSYPVPEGPDGNLRCYKLTAVYESETDYCESAPFTAKDNPDEDYVCVTLVGNQEHKNNQSFQVNIFPNPAEDKVSINSSEAIRQIDLINYTGQTVLLKQMNDKEVTLNMNGLKPGIYIAQIKTEKGIMIRKVVLK